MRIYFPDNWFNVRGVDYGADSISLSAIVPMTGQRHLALFCWRQEPPIGEVVTVLWQPPYTAFNGWSERPSEIAQSFLVSAKAVRAYADTHSQKRYEFDIISTKPLLPTLKSLCSGGSGEGKLGEVSATAAAPARRYLDWGEDPRFSVANIAGLTYLAGMPRAEGFIELIVETIDGDIFELFGGHSDPGGTEYYLGRRKLSGPDFYGVRIAIENEKRIGETYRPYLVE